MAQQVFVHIGLPKTGTTYLQDVLRSNADRLTKAGLLYVGDSWYDHANASAVIRDLPRLKNFGPHALKSWDRLRQQALEFPGTSALLSHEYFCAASTEQAQRAIGDLQPSEVHLILTVRDLPALLTAAWQQEVKKSETRSLTNWWPDENSTPESRCSWRTLDPTGVLDRWAPHVPTDRMHIVTVPPRGAAQDALLHRFAAACGINLSGCDLSVDDTNASLGVVAVELKRRVNQLVGPPIRGWREVPRWLRDYLAGSILSRYDRERFRLSDKQITALNERTETILAYIRAKGFPVEGDLEDLRSHSHGADRRTPDDVGDAEVADMAVRAIADMLQDVRRLSRKNAELQRQLKALRRPTD